MSEHITILGGGNTAFATAANLTLKGFAITLCELPEFGHTLDPVRDQGVIHLVGVEETGAAKVHCMTTDIEAALNASDLILLIVPAYAHKPFAIACAPHLRPEHMVVLMPGTLGALEWATLLRDQGVADIALAEVDTAPYVCRKTAPDTATIWGYRDGLGLGGVASDRNRSRARSAVAAVPGHSDLSHRDGLWFVRDESGRASCGCVDERRTNRIFAR